MKPYNKAIPRRRKICCRWFTKSCAGWPVRKWLSKPAGITVTGRLSPAAGNERVTVSYLPPGSSRWQHQTVAASATGSYTTSWHVRRGNNRFVAQWAGDFRSKGDGSGVLTVKVGK